MSTKEIQYLVEEFLDNEGYVTSIVCNLIEFAEGFLHGLE